MVAVPSVVANVAAGYMAATMARSLTLCSEFILLVRALLLLTEGSVGLVQQCGPDGHSWI
jgi:hypothetical protein